MAEEDASNRVRRRLSEDSGRAVPTSALGRLGRTLGLAARVGVGNLLTRGRGTTSPVGALDEAAIERLVLSLGALKGVAMKMGQMLSYVDVSLPESSRRMLALLQERSQPTAWADVEQTLRADLGTRAHELLATMEHDPIATASIGQVHRAVLPDGTAVAVKVRHPGIEDAIRADFRSAAVGQMMARLMAPGSSIKGVIEEARARFLEECDYALEATRQRRFAELWHGDPDIVIPAVHDDYCGPRVLTTTFCPGAGLEQWLAQDPGVAARNRLGRALYDFYLGSLYRYGLFNADPHPGNLRIASDGRVFVLDYGCVREFDRRTVHALAELAAAVRVDDDGRIRDALGVLGVADPDREYATTRELLRAFFRPLLQPGVHRLDAAVDLGTAAGYRTKKQIMRLGLPGQLLFLFRIRFGLYAVLARVGAELDWQALEDELATAARPARGSRVALP